MDSSWFLSGLDELVATRPAALGVFQGHWKQTLSREALNQEVLAAALLQVLDERYPNESVVVRGVAPTTELLCRELLVKRRQVALDLAGYQTQAQRMFEMPVLAPGTPVAGAVVVSANVDSPTNGGVRATPQGLEAAGCISVAEPAVRARYSELLSVQRQALGAALDALIGAPGESVLFVSQKSYYNQLRTSTALRRRGVRTVALVLDPNLRGHKQSYFDEVICTDLLSFLLWIQRAAGALLHTQGWLFRYHIPVLIDAFLGSECRQCVELMDLNSFLFPEALRERALPYMRSAWGNQVETEQALQVRCEQYLGAHADALLYPGSERHVEALGFLGLGREQHYLQFLSYPLSDFCVEPKANATASAPSAELPRLVFAGGVVPVDERRRPELFGDAQMVTTAELILHQGLLLHVYNNPLHAPPETYAYRYAAHLELARRFEQYRFSLGALPWELGPLLAPYDLGLIVYDYTGVLFGEEHFRNIIPAKLFMYLEAGLPVLVSRRAEATCNFVESHGCGVGVDAAELSALPALLRRLDLPALRAGVKRVQLEFSMDTQVARLSQLYRRMREPRAALPRPA